MKLGLIPAPLGPKVSVPIQVILHAENLGFDSAWTAEAYGGDAVSTASWILAQTSKIKVGTAIMQMQARTPAMAAMTAMSLADLSDGRFICGLGASGPQVVEGWHGQAFGKPVTRLKEYAAIMRQIIARENALSFDGQMYQLPFSGEGATGQGKPMKSILRCEHSIPIYGATITPTGVAAAAEVCDGFFPVWMDPERFDVFEEPINKGFAAAGNGKNLSNFDIAPTVKVVIGDDVEQCMQPIRELMALYIGGMGSRKKNFYNDYAKRLGFEDAAVKIQDLFLSGKREEAAAAVPAELVDACHLVGPSDRIKDRLQRWREAGKKQQVSSMLIDSSKLDVLELMAESLL